MKNHFYAPILIAVIVMGIIGTAGAAEEPASNVIPVITNVWFARMTETSDSYVYELLPTGYIGLNDYGRMTFVTGAANISTGDYAIVQETRNGTALLKALRLTKSGDSTPEYTMLTLELNKEDLAEPLDIPTGTETSITIVPQTTSLTPATTPAAAATKAPAGIATILAGLCIAVFIGTYRLRR
jgi:hypothetical protein